MKILKKVLNTILHIAEVIFFVMMIYCFTEIKSDSFANVLGGIILFLFFSALFILCIGIEVLKVGHRNKCPWCNKWFALKKQGEEYVGSEEISVKVSTHSEEYYSNGTTTGRYSIGEQYVPGVKETYHINYLCKKCGKSCYSTKYKRHASI